MKTPAEVIAEGLISSIECKEPTQTRGPLRILHRKRIQINFPNLHEAIVIYFTDDADNDAGIQYEIHPTPVITCRHCGWKGDVADLPVEEKQVQIKEMSELVWEQSALMNPTVRKVTEKCPHCGSTSLSKREYRYRGRDLWIIGSHNDIAKLGMLVDPVIPHRVNGLFNAVWSYLITEKIKLRPLWQLGLAIQFGRLLL
jgi:hypothetical protein